MGKRTLRERNTQNLDAEHMLEILDVGCAAPPHPVPVLFVPGAYHGAWCWQDHFLDYFAERGYRALAVSLRGHGGSTPEIPLGTCTIASYAEDVGAAVNEVGSPLILVGHSMGGFVVQKYLEKYLGSVQIPAAVLVASAPPRTVWRSAGPTFARHPWLTMQTNIGRVSSALMGTQARVREHLFNSATPQSVVQACARRIQPESNRALRGMLYRDRVRPAEINTPILVMGAEHDCIITRRQVYDTADAYHTSAQIVGGMGHNMMLEPGWRSVADHIIDWLAVQGL